MSDLELIPETLDAMAQAAKRLGNAFLDFAQAVGYIYNNISPTFYKVFKKNKKRDLYLRKYKRRGERMKRGS